MSRHEPKLQLNSDFHLSISVMLDQSVTLACSLASNKAVKGIAMTTLLESLCPTDGDIITFCAFTKHFKEYALQGVRNALKLNKVPKCYLPSLDCQSTLGGSYSQGRQSNRSLISGGQMQIITQCLLSLPPYSAL